MISYGWRPAPTTHPSSYSLGSGRLPLLANRVDIILFGLSGILVKEFGLVGLLPGLTFLVFMFQVVSADQHGAE